MRRAFLLLLAGAAFYGCQQNPTDNGTPKRYYLVGNVRKSPINPIEHEGMDNSAPLPGAPIRVAGGALDTTMISDTNGYFILEVKEGVYTIAPQEMPEHWPSPPNAFGAVVGMNSGHDTTTLNIVYETHIK